MFRTCLAKLNWPAITTYEARQTTGDDYVSKTGSVWARPSSVQ